MDSYNSFCSINGLATDDLVQIRSLLGGDSRPREAMDFSRVQLLENTSGSLDSLLGQPYPH